MASRLHDHLVLFAGGFGPGLTAVTRRGDPVEVGIDFGILRLAAGETHRTGDGLESAILLLAGEVELRWGKERALAARASLLDEDPTVLHLPAGVEVQVTARRPSELALIQVTNERHFPARLYRPEEVEREQRGRGLLEDTAHRIVKTVFDGRSRPDSNLVLGEVVNLPGRWSSYPPHHHPQPEIYHYRFSDPRGYGHGELGDEVLKIRDGDTLAITDGKDHAQTAAPGYGMYYLWAIRNLPGAPYTSPVFSEEHRWLLEPGAPIWRPRVTRRDPEAGEPR
jgi:5-deoxy-glucuronate isomerase